jgi:hypothetical protein
LRWQRNGNYQNCEEKKNCTKKSGFHFVLRSLSRGS